MKTVDERVENLSDDLLDSFIYGVSCINCGSLDKLNCNDCPLQIDGVCLSVKLHYEKENRRGRESTNEETVPSPTALANDLETNAKELVKQLGHLVELLSKF